eukprot:1397449-Prymnesium_polylepis.1
MRLVPGRRAPPPPPPFHRVLHPSPSRPLSSFSFSVLSFLPPSWPVLCSVPARTPETALCGGGLWGR